MTARHCEQCPTPCTPMACDDFLHGGRLYELGGRRWVWLDPTHPVLGPGTAVRWRPWRPGHWLALWHHRRWERRWFGTSWGRF